MTPWGSETHTLPLSLSQSSAAICGIPGTVQRLHTPPEGETYAGGWMIDVLPGGGTRHWHDGTAGTFYASIQLFPERNLGLVVLLNAGDAAVVEAIAEAVASSKSNDEK